MEADGKDLTTINFNSDWKCLRQLSTDKADEKTMLSTLHSLDTDHHWSSVELPHIVDTNKQETCKWWYYKQFDWTSINKQLEQQIYLSFKPFSDFNSDSSLSNITGKLWLNNTQIFFGSLLTLDGSIELPTKLLHSGNTETNKCDNTLVIYCSGTSLSLHACLILFGKVICATGQVKVDENTVSNQEDSLINGNDVLDYAVSIDDTSGRINVQFNSKKKYRAPLKPSKFVSDEKQSDKNREESNDDFLVPRLAILILIVGTRGDVQPFIAFGQALRANGHRVRLATHETFRSFVRGNGLEFYPLAGDPADLISFMVKNAGIIPSMDSIIAGDVKKKRRSLADILASTWQACTANDDETNVPFIAEAIIANPPSFGHIHCAEKLQIPLHIMFTMPWSPTTSFPHPLSNIDSSAGSRKTVNRYSYDVIEMLTWTGMRDIVNNFRKKTLGLQSLNTTQAINVMIDERVPHTYCWSPSLVSKPNDWGAHIDVSGFFFLDLGTTYTDPPQDLLNFLENHRETKRSPPIYIGFGSIAGHDSRRILAVVIDALDRTGYRAVLSGLASDTDRLPSNVFKIGNVPHDWLFQHVVAVCHHGGAGTTAAGLRAGKPTIIIPFFGDQFFWGTVIENSGAGPHPIPGKSITVNELADAFHFVHKPTTRAAAERLRDSILREDGCTAAVHAFHANLPFTRLYSDLEPTFAACYRADKYNIQISRPVAQVLLSANLLDESELRPHMTREWQFMHDNHMHIVTHGLIEHSHKAFSNMFIDTASDLKRAANNDSKTMMTVESAKSVAKGFGLGIGHLTIGYLSLYGEITDTLVRVTHMYDPYSDPRACSRPRVNDFKSGAKAASQALVSGWKDGVTDMITQPPAGFKRHGVLGGAAGSLMATVNICVKPTVGTLASITWMGRGTYASVKNAVENYKKEGRRMSTKLFEDISSLSIVNDTQTQDEEDVEIPATVRTAAKISGFHPKICQHVIHEFEKIKIEHEQKLTASPLKKRNPFPFFSHETKNK